MTDVIFRKFEDGKIAALFTKELGSMNPQECLCVSSDGSGAIDVLKASLNSVVAKPEEYKELKAELEAAGYRLKVRKRVSKKDFEFRCEAVKELKRIQEVSGD